MPRAPRYPRTKRQIEPEQREAVLTLLVELSGLVSQLKRLVRLLADEIEQGGQ